MSDSILLTDVDTMYLSEIGEVLNMKKLGAFFCDPDLFLRNVYLRTFPGDPFQSCV